MEGYILKTDQEQDRIRHEYLLEVLKVFGF